MNSQAMIVDCAIRDNRAEQGGGAYLTGTPTFTNCTFSGNQADASGGGAYVGGAAAFTNCTIDPASLSPAIRSRFPLPERSNKANRKGEILCWNEYDTEYTNR